MKKVYVAHPYGGKEENKQAVENIIRQFVKQHPDIFFCLSNPFDRLLIQRCRL